MIEHKNALKFNIELKENKNEIEIIKKLAKDCLKFKWIKDKGKNLNKVLSPCAFCIHYKMENESCDSCSIDKHICAKNGEGGLIGYILSKHGNVYLKDIDKSVYSMVRYALNELKLKGILSEKSLSNLKDSKDFR